MGEMALGVLVRSNQLMQIPPAPCALMGSAEMYRVARSSCVPGRCARGWRATCANTQVAKNVRCVSAAEVAKQCMQLATAPFCQLPNAVHFWHEAKAVRPQNLPTQAIVPVVCTGRAAPWP